MKNNVEIVWKDTKYSKVITLEEMATRALDNLIDHKCNLYNNKLSEALVAAQNHHDELVRRFGWTKLIKPRTFTIDDMLEDECIAEDLWYVENVGKNIIDMFELIKECASTAENMTFSIDVWQSLAGWYEHVEQ